MTQEMSIDALFEVGAHYGYSRGRRHPSAEKFIFGQKDKHDIFDLEKTLDQLKKAKEAIAALSKGENTVFFLGGKNEARSIVRAAAEHSGQPYVAGRYIGGTLTNFKEVRKRVDELEKLMADRESGAFAKYTKLERLMKDRKIADLESKFGGLIPMKKLPAAVVVVDPTFEDKGVREAINLNIPVIALASSDCDMVRITYPVPANDSTRASIQYFVDQIASVLS